MVALDGHDWGAPPIRGIGKLGALDATVGSGALQEAAARDYRGSGHCSTGGQHQTEEPGFPLPQPRPGDGASRP
jgi:hypothetical protein